MAISLRERKLTGRGVGALGTTNNPLPLEGLIGVQEPTIQKLALRLGFEAIPSTQVFSFLIARPAQLRVLRTSTDPYVVHVAVGLQGPDDNRGPGRRPLVQTQGGDSGWHTIEAGRWWLVVASGMPIDIQFELEVQLLAVPAMLQQARCTPSLPAVIDATPERALVADAHSSEPALLKSSGGHSEELVLEPAPALATPRSGAPTYLLEPVEPSLAITRCNPGIDAAKLRSAALLPAGFDLWTMRPWRGGILNGFLWLRDRRGHLHLFSPWPLLVLPLPAPLTPDAIELEVEGHGIVPVRADAAAYGIGQALLGANTPGPADPLAITLTTGNCRIAGTWYSAAGGAKDEVT